jgi:hypothetical protein
MNSTPADSNAARMFSSVLARGLELLHSIALKAVKDSPLICATAAWLSPSMARAPLIWLGEIIVPNIAKHEFITSILDFPPQSGAS